MADVLSFKFVSSKNYTLDLHMAVFAPATFSQDLLKLPFRYNNFTDNDVRKNVRELSGGEAIRIVLCLLFLGGYNVLILDEPTNFLDIYCIQALERFIKGYEGTVILVSHDAVFVEHIADYIYVIEEEKIKK